MLVSKVGMVLSLERQEKTLVSKMNKATNTKIFTETYLSSRDVSMNLCILI